MTIDLTRKIYEDLGVQPAINASGNRTVLGGSRLSPTVQEAAEAANRYYVDMETLMLRSGAAIADMLNAESAMVTPGCFAAIALGVTAIMAGSNPDKIAQLPDTSGMKNEILFQQCQTYKYERALTIFGGKLVKFGDDHTATVAQMEAAITAKTAAVHYLAVERLSIGKGEASLPFETVVEVAHRHGLPVIVDAASEIYPLERLHHFTNLGADLVCFGAKYMGAYNGTGILAGRKTLLDSAYRQSLVSFETANNAAVGRPLKLDRQEIVAVVAALREWIEMDHEDRLDTHEKRGAMIAQAVQGLDHVNTTWVPDERSLGSAVHVTIDEAALGKSAAQVQRALQAGTPSIMALSQENVLRLTVPTLYEGEAEIVAERLRAVLTEK